MARSATSAEARLIHYQLAGAYSIKAMAAAPRRPRKSPFAHSDPVERSAPRFAAGTGGVTKWTEHFGIAPTIHAAAPCLAMAEMQ